MQPNLTPQHGEPHKDPTGPADTSCNHCLSKVGGGLSLKAQISRPSFLPHSSLFPFWPPTLSPKFVAWESRYQVPLPAVSVFLCLSFLTCVLKMRSSLQALPALPLVPPSFLLSHTLLSVFSLSTFLMSVSSPTFSFLLSHLFLLTSLHLCPIFLSPSVPLLALKEVKDLVAWEPLGLGKATVRVQAPLLP